MKYLIVILLNFISFQTLFSQPNCEVYKSDETCYNSCQTAWQAIRYGQGSYQSQALFDQSIEECPTFAYSYMEKAVPFLKRGLFIEWKKLIDKAVDLSPKEYLGYRGWCRLQFLRDYEGCIEDIEELKRISKYDIGYCQTGEYHLDIVLALCYKEIGQLEKAKELFYAKVNTKDYSNDLHNYYHLGRIEYELKNYEIAKELFEKQIENNELAEPWYYLALTNKKLNQIEDYRKNLDKAEQLYRQGRSMFDNYAEPIDKIFLNDIINEKSKAGVK